VSHRPASARAAFELQPQLTGQRILLRPLVPADFDALFAAASDPLIWEQHPEPDRYTREVFQRYFDGGIASGGAFAIVDRATGRIIGSSRYCNLKPEESEVEIGWTFLERAHWGGETNRELKKLMLDHAFRFVDRVVFMVGENNMRSRTAVEKIGGRLWKRAEATDWRGGARANVIYKIEKGELPMQKIVTSLWFDNNVEEAVNLYTSVFPNSKIVSVSRYGDAGPGPKGQVLAMEFELAGQRFTAINGGPQFKFTEAISLMVKVETQAELDEIWNKLLAGGGKPSQCGWLKDRFGLSWQVTPTVLGAMLADKDPEKAKRVMQTMLPMQKLDIAALKQAYEGTVASRH
jgi:predicted 3-demethylubiquinone-9 3-methyltransferase (glyoxalase superfamily)/RimJ/RimL family protein N-acetyltransferase